jgi:hypothetical protein
MGREEPDGTFTVLGFSKTRRVTSREKLLEAGYTLRPLSPRTANAYRVFYPLLNRYVRGGFPLPSDLDDETLAGYALAVSIMLQQEFERLRRGTKPYHRRRFNTCFKILAIDAIHALDDPLGFLIHVSTFTHVSDLAKLPPVLHRAFDLLMAFARGITMQLVHRAIKLGGESALIEYEGECWSRYELRPSAPGIRTHIVRPTDQLREVESSVRFYRQRLGQGALDFMVFCDGVFNDMHCEKLLNEITSDLYCLVPPEQMRNSTSE